MSGTHTFEVGRICVGFKIACMIVVDIIKYIQWSKKETFRLGTGPQFPPNDSNLSFFDDSVLLGPH